MGVAENKLAFKKNCIGFIGKEGAEDICSHYNMSSGCCTFFSSSVTGTPFVCDDKVIIKNGRK